MSKALSRAGPLKPDVRLGQALSEFEASLSPGDKARLRSSKSQFRSIPPTVDDVMRLTAEVDDHAKRSLSSGRCFGPRLSSMLHAVQQFVALGDIMIGGSQNLIACGVWSVVRITILAATLSSSGMERLSLLFMAAGRSAPRYQGLTLLYARSRLMQDYLAEYMIIVVQMCHYFHDFSRKSTIGQITSSLSESKIQNAEKELNQWAQLIKDEADYHLAQTTEHEATENRNFRNLLSRSMKSSSQQQKMDKRFQWLTAFSTFDYETPWKQARKRGSPSSFVDIPGYKKWKERNGPPSFLLSGKMGCGKSVIMANMVDDLSISCPEDVILYFFCRHDIPESLTARTIFGSFAAQIFRRCLSADTMDEIFINENPSMTSFEKILDILPAMIKRIEGVRLLLDGVDECPEPEFDLIRTGLHQLSAECSILLCVSYRNQADGVQAKVWGTGPGTMVSIIDNNSDISGFIDAELQQMKESGKLSIRDEGLLVTIRDALLHGANGMFLWVVLQISTICAEKTDHSIRQALENLPTSLSATFRRILEKSKQKGHCYQKQILEILVGANRPLTVAEFREALSVTPGDVTWDPRKSINDIHSTLACCGSLVIIDEEEGTVRLIHQSVVQFLHAAGPDSMEWSFTAQDADAHLGEITMTYLNYDVFDKRVSTKVMPQIHAGGVAGTIVTQALRPFGSLGRRVSQSVMKRQKSLNRDIGETLFKAQSSLPMHQDFNFLAYSSKNFLIHTSRMSNTTSLTIQLLRRLLNNPQFIPWSLAENDIQKSTVRGGSIGINSSITNPTQPRDPDQPDKVSNITLQLQWAIWHSHSLLFSMSMHDRSGVSALFSILRHLTYLMDTRKQLRVESHMCDKLLLITTSFRCKKLTEWLVAIHGVSLAQYLELLRSAVWYEYRVFQWAVVRDCFEDLHNIVEPLLEEAIAEKDLQTVKYLLRKGANLIAYTREPPLRTAIRLSSSDPAYLLLVFRILSKSESLDALNLSASDVDGFRRSLFLFANPRTILRGACERGDRFLVELLLAGHIDMSASECNSLICKTLYAPFPEPADIVRLLLKDWQFSTGVFAPAMRQAVELRDWRSASEVARFLGFSFRVDTSLLKFCLESRDFEGVNFILNYTIPIQSPDGGKSYSLFYEMPLDWGDLQGCCKLLEYAASVTKTISRLTDGSKEAWAVKGDDVLAFSLCQPVLQYLFERNHFASDNAHRDENLKFALLFNLNNILEDFSGSFQDNKKARWLEMTGIVLQSYRLLTASSLERVTGSRPLWELWASINILRLSIVRIAETMMRKRHNLVAGEEWQITDDDWFLIDQRLHDWSLDSVMGRILEMYGFKNGNKNPQDVEQYRLETSYMPLGWQAFAVGPKVVQLFKDHDLELDQLRAAELCLASQVDWLDDGRIEKTTTKWEAEFHKRLSIGRRAELPAEGPAQGSRATAL